jgi:protein gp37
VENTAIEWADHTHNEWVGCQKISPACDHCYAESWAKRTGSADLWAGNTRLTSERNRMKPFKWEALARLNGCRYRVFSSSLSDWLDNRVPYEWVHGLCATIDRTPHLDWLLLSKRIGNLRQRVPAHWWPKLPPNVWIGATIANQEEADRDIPKLLAIGARVRFLSMEPLLGPVRLDRLMRHSDDYVYVDDALTGFVANKCGGHHGRKVDWVIVGGESGGHARPMRLSWVRSLRDQCATAGVPFFFKQHGEWAPALSGTFYHPLHDGPTFVPRAGGKDTHDFGDGHGAVRIGKKAAGRMLDGRIYGEFPA